jgi:hypothetical protein
MVLPMLASVVWFGRQVRQQQLDHALIEAIKKQDTPTGISLLSQGADANAVDRPYKPMTYGSLLTDWWNRLKGIKPQPNTKNYSPALMLVYGPIEFNLPDTSLVMDLNADEVTQVDDSHANNKAPRRLVSALLEHGADLDTKDRVGDVLLEYACICNDRETVKVLLQHHVNPNARGTTGYPALMCTDDYDCERLLLEFGADANARDSGGRTRLMCIYNTELYPILIQHGANPNAQDVVGRTPLVHLFVSLYQDDKHIHTGMRFLIQHGAKVALKDSKGKTALDYAKAGKANWMAMHTLNGGYDKYSIHDLDEALKRELVQKKRRN